MAHPYEGQVKASNARRLRALGAKAGKPFGASAMFHAKSYPKKNAGTERPMTLEGGSSRKRADRKSNKYADGGKVGGGSFGGGGGGFGGPRSGGGGGKKKGHSTTNIIIAGHPGGGGGGPQPVPVPVPRPVPVPVAAGAPPPRPAGPPGGLPPMAGGAPPVSVNVPPPAPGGMPMRPPGMRAGGGVKKLALGGPAGGYSPAAQAGIAMGGPQAMGRAPGFPAGIASTQPGPMQTMPPPGLGSGPPPGVVGNTAGMRMPMYKKGGAVHDDAAQDKKLIRQMMKSEDKAEGKKRGGKVKKYQFGGETGDDTQRKQDEADDAAADKADPSGYGELANRGKDAIKTAQAAMPKPPTAAGGPDPGAGAGAFGKSIADANAAVVKNFSGQKPVGTKLASVPTSRSGSPFSLTAKDGGFIPKDATSKDPALSASKYRQQGAGYARGGGIKHGGGLSGSGRLAKIPAARGVPAKTEI